MTLQHPLYLFPALAIAGGALWLYLRLERGKTRNDLAYSNLAFFEAAVAPRAWIPMALRWGFACAFGALALAAAGPRLLLPVPVSDAAAFICIDTSGSMAATDVDPTRAQAALAAARAFLAEAAPGTRIGIIAFSSQAEIVQPLTADRATQLSGLNQVPSPNGVTAIGDALQLAAQSLPPTGRRTIVLVTDGVNNAGVDPQEVAQWLGAHRVPVYTIGIGTANGGIIPGTADEATIDEGALQAYAQASGGAYARAQDATQLRAELQRLGRIVSFERKPVDASLGFAWAGAALMVATFFAGFGIGRFS